MIVYGNRMTKCGWVSKCYIISFKISLNVYSGIPIAPALVIMYKMFVHAFNQYYLIEIFL